VIELNRRPKAGGSRQVKETSGKPFFEKPLKTTLEKAFASRQSRRGRKLKNGVFQGVSQMSVRHYTAKDEDWYHYRDRQIWNRTKGGKSEWIVTYDEGRIVTRDALTIRSSESVKTAKSGEVIFLAKGTKASHDSARRNPNGDLL
jgi:hypothetical protein